MNVIHMSVINWRYFNYFLLLQNIPRLTLSERPYSTKPEKINQRNLGDTGTGHKFVGKGELILFSDRDYIIMRQTVTIKKSSDHGLLSKVNILKLYYLIFSGHVPHPFSALLYQCLFNGSITPGDFLKLFRETVIELNSSKHTRYYRIYSSINSYDGNTIL